MFVRGDDGDIFHTYSAYHRGAELLIGAFNWLDLVVNVRFSDWKVQKRTVGSRQDPAIPRGILPVIRGSGADSDSCRLVSY